MSRPTEIMFVASATSTWSLLEKSWLKPPLGLGHLVGADAGGQFHRLVVDASVYEETVNFAHALAAAVAGQLGCSLRLRPPAAPRQAPEGC